MHREARCFSERMHPLTSLHPAIKAVAFVSESTTGGAIMAQGAPTLKRRHAGLGGKNPVMVFDDADLERALDAVVLMIYSLNGERCTSSGRVLVQGGLYQTFTNRIREGAEQVNVGSARFEGRDRSSDSPTAFRQELS